MIFRERTVEFQKAVFLGRILGLALGVDSTKIARAENILASSIFHTAHDPRALQLQMLRSTMQAQKAFSQRVEDAKILAKTASYSDDTQDVQATAASFTENVLGRRIPKG